ncbi:hypothetical protein A1O3_07238 [Capronia epimyces CBS 606.96]|uniref:Uncharacterized protein n=1 Tax=Capronia epimyces CBS 606.96 TaxID=1182542 RepID=W9XUE0_9EURO|nr:uncharacterized protein A1O3_07238 [Capronia epimyces CBS 606.96]EXJ80950.1 hypothetical protein A1O3_07238 [Capronia epimyces CBS 606.96]
MPPFKDEHVLIIAPGSQITAAQLGLPESFTPPRYRFPTRMFPGTKPDEWEPVKIRPKPTPLPGPAEPTSSGEPGDTDQPNGQATNGDLPSSEQANGHPVPSEDVEMKEAPAGEETTAATNPASEAPPKDTPQQEASQQDVPPDAPPDADDETTETFEDDLWSTEGAVYPIREGRIENWSCFFALLSHIYNMMSPPFHMPVLFVAQPCWTSRDHERITQFVFETWKVPAFCLMDAALTACYAYGVPTALVVDVGHGKCDVTAVTDFQVNDIGRGIAIPDCGGHAMTKRLQQVLESDAFTEDMAEQLKRSPICEILPTGVEVPQGISNDAAPNPAAAASTGALDSGINAKDVDGLRPGQAPRGPGIGTMVGEEGLNGNEEENDGVLDVAAIVARDNAAELLARREKEKAEKAAAKKGAAADGLKIVRLRNSERERASFTYVDFLPIEEPATTDGEQKGRKRKREIEVGVERFMAGTPLPGVGEGVIDTIAEAIHHAVLSVPDIALRSTLWENLIILGNGSRIRGFTPSLLSVLHTRYVLSPSTATIFTSELPSNFTTPVATPGTNTPIPGQGGHTLHHPGPHGVNPLLVAATKNMMQPNQHLPVPGQPGSVLDPGIHHIHRGFSQTPNSIKMVKAPDYFPEWKDPSVHGMEEAGFLGAQVAAKVVFIVDQGNSKGFLTRSEYNELGPTGIHDCAI